jgi:hypothetical protein
MKLKNLKFKKYKFLWVKQLEINSVVKYLEFISLEINGPLFIDKTFILNFDW